ncbi:alpha-ketoglutarate-dependent dioxygenase AlkB [Actinomadura barringtoniae]|uniref:Alpha-ketoglutarate-dependent dioxygenase AlkB n=1 Tax=Actinomadura barringtoniae TaxID=1427535 RepID=A0A939PJ30_9ACTN|nr:alpha-ketoglutarate-dependent dioxygenase AlkB [Actinomadura barringtoniae]MBO2453656.1 alpha-ketoglutarate-dependent dioxygenase AlkB [Actinomadura barringtoniae]
MDEEEQKRLADHIDAGQWSRELKRRVQHYGHRYEYGRRGVSVRQAPPLPPWALELAVRLRREGRVEDVADQVIVNEYQPGQGISAHVDCVPCFGPIVASVSLLSACVMEFLGPERVPVWLEPGSLCLMTGDSRFIWRHAIPARKTDPGPNGRIPRGRRVSVTLRTVL